jgi:hypothetical protein
MKIIQILYAHLSLKILSLEKKKYFFRAILVQKMFLTFFGNIYETKNFLFYSFVFKLFYGGASRKKKSKIDFSILPRS